ncbi:CRAL-TRIO domain-containing protein [Mycena pura]|uniref:CRAL-TRIO domain-containing protein n=1 Tax=Mycena pura TaxID=153505 RepID=A0AAD6YK58_9AGAR|nr:CRAL-TRIO domain-containing protein [Mycena pura]
MTTEPNGNGALPSDVDPLAGHIGHLSPEQEAKLTELKAACARDGVYEPATARPTPNEAVLLRYLRARKWSVPDALQQLKDTEAWRETNKLYELYDTIDADAFEDARKVYHMWSGRRDLEGRPVYVYEISHLKNNMASFERSSTSLQSPATAADPIPGKLRTLCALYEHMTAFVLPMCDALPDRPHPETPISTTTHIVDVSGLGLMGFWNLKAHMQAASTLASAHYPETLERLYMVGTPLFFPTVWGWIKRWFDPVTTAKIHILAAADVAPTLRLAIRPADLPRKYGGELEWEYGMPPSADAGIVRAVVGLKAEPDAWVGGPLRWVPQPGGGAKVVARGTVQGKQRDEVVAVFDSGEVKAA